MKGDRGNSEQHLEWAEVQDESAALDEAGACEVEVRIGEKAAVSLDTPVSAASARADCRKMSYLSSACERRVRPRQNGGGEDDVGGGEAGRRVQQCGRMHAKRPPMRARMALPVFAVLYLARNARMCACSASMGSRTSAPEFAMLAPLFHRPQLGQY